MCSNHQISLSLSLSLSFSAVSFSLSYSDVTALYWSRKPLFDVGLFKKKIIKRIKLTKQNSQRSRIKRKEMIIHHPNPNSHSLFYKKIKNHILSKKQTSNQRIVENFKFHVFLQTHKFLSFFFSFFFFCLEGVLFWGIQVLTSNASIVLNFIIWVVI